MLHTIELSGPKAKILDTTVARTLGKVDMYRDFAKTENQQGLEKQLADLESLAGRVVAAIRKRFEAGNEDVWITRLERDTLRKFLFIMKYRSSNMHKRFCPETFEDYSSDDREELLEYVRGKDFEKPIDVWFDNIKAMLELEMDPGGKWMKEIRKRAYPPDAEWFVHHTQGMFMALCTPSEQEDEFLLTENGYGIHEGPVSGLVNPSTGQFTATSYTEYHVFAIISPRLMIVLRSFVLPNSMEDNLESIRKYRETVYRICASMHVNPNEAHSILADLPISKARNSYTKLMGGRLVLLNGEDGTHRADHKFCFRFFPVATDHVDKINAIMLEESYGISTIVFGTRTGARKIFESYLSAVPSAESSFKTVSGKPDDPRLNFLQKLEHVAKQMGSTVVAVYRTRNQPTEEERDEAVAKMMELTPLEERGEHMQLYMRLGGSYATLMKDMEQARNMMNMRIKFDVWSTGLNEHIRNNIRENLRHIFSQLPARRVWYYLKHIRNIALRDRSIEGSVICEGPDDVIAKGDTFLLSHVIRGEAIARLMFAVVLNQISLASHPDFEFYPTIISEASWRSISRSKQIIFSSAGSICDCGINEIEQKARLLRDKLQNSSYLKTFANLFLPKNAMIRHPLWSDKENIEMQTRFHTRIVFPGLVEKLGQEEEDELDEVLFNIAYPSPSPFLVFNNEKKAIQAYQWINSMVRQ
ncbi:hypothetical protein V499_07421 [Pseudogymnoascus sp. VKM F-103]|nr:hypothetical protein V499_07421 [Pseudogymnoascus sp. VKM F-103]